MTPEQHAAEAQENGLGFVSRELLTAFAKRVHDDGKIGALEYITLCCDSVSHGDKVPAYKAALEHITVFANAAIERTREGGPLHSEAATQS